MSKQTLERSPSRQMEATEALQLAILLQWMSEARHILRQVQMAAKHHPDLEQALTRHDIRYELSWESEQEQAASGLFYELRDKIEALA